MTQGAISLASLDDEPEYEATRVIRALLIQGARALADDIGGCFGTSADRVADIALEYADRLDRALERLASGQFDVVLLDLSLPGVAGLDGVAALIATAPDVPVVVVAERAQERLAVAAIKAGAQDYVTKRDDDARIVRHAMRHAIDRHLHRREREGLLVREREARAAAERATRVRDEVLGMVSHDLRSPLTAIAMSANALLEGSGELTVLANAIMRSSEWALRIIRDLLDVTAIEAGGLAIHREPMTVQAILEMISSMFASPAAVAGVTLTVERIGPPLWVDADVDRVVQAVGNLVGNAIKFTPRGGRVSLTVQRRHDVVVFRVEDTGPGIAADDLPRLFDRFWQAHESGRAGAGLGLVIAQGIAIGHGGRVEVESRLGHGSVFTLVLPDQP
jgi:signal transduction histidine kinase